MQSLQNQQIFAEICGFYQQFAKKLELKVPDFEELHKWLLDNRTVPAGLVNVLRQLLSKHWFRTTNNFWQPKLIEFCDNYYREAADELKVVGSYNKLAQVMRLEILRALQDTLFDRNGPLMRFIASEPSEKLRAQQLGQDSYGRSYFMFAPPQTQCFEFYFESRSLRKYLIAKNCAELKRLVRELKRSHAAPMTQNTTFHWEQKQLIALLDILAKCLY